MGTESFEGTLLVALDQEVLEYPESSWARQLHCNNFGGDYAVTTDHRFWNCNRLKYSFNIYIYGYLIHTHMAYMKFLTFTCERYKEIGISYVDLWNLTNEPSFPFVKHAHMQIKHVRINLL